MEHEIDPLEDILVTVGAFHAVFCALQALTDKDDEVKRSREVSFITHGCFPT